MDGSNVFLQASPVVAGRQSSELGCGIPGYRATRRSGSQGARRLLARRVELANEPADFMGQHRGR